MSIILIIGACVRARACVCVCLRHATYADAVFMVAANSLHVRVRQPHGPNTATPARLHELVVHSPCGRGGPERPSLHACLQDKADSILQCRVNSFTNTAVIRAKAFSFHPSLPSLPVFAAPASIPTPPIICFLLLAPRRYERSRLQYQSIHRPPRPVHSLIIGAHLVLGQSARRKPIVSKVLRHVRARAAACTTPRFRPVCSVCRGRVDAPEEELTVCGPDVGVVCRAAYASLQRTVEDCRHLHDKQLGGTNDD